MDSTLNESDIFSDGFLAKTFGAKATDLIHLFTSDDEDYADYRWNIHYEGRVIAQNLFVPFAGTAREKTEREKNRPLTRPRFLINKEGGVGIPLADIVGGDLSALQGYDAPMGDRYSVKLDIWLGGYRRWEKQIQTRDDTAARKPITFEKLVTHVANRVKDFLESGERDTTRPMDLEWTIKGMNQTVEEAHEISVENLALIGVTFVSQGAIMPILQRMS